MRQSGNAPAGNGSQKACIRDAQFEWYTKMVNNSTHVKIQAQFHELRLQVGVCDVQTHSRFCLILPKVSRGRDIVFQSLYVIPGHHSGCHAE